jgi:hypothetical protein
LQEKGRYRHDQKHQGGGNSIADAIGGITVPPGQQEQKVIQADFPCTVKD